MEVVTQSTGQATTNPVYVDLEPARLFMISGGTLSPAIRQERIETYDGDRSRAAPTGPTFTPQRAAQRRADRDLRAAQ